MFFWFLRNPSQVKNYAVFTEDCKYSEETAKHPDIAGLQICSRRSSACGTTEHSDKSEEGGDTESHPARDKVRGDEEGQPGDADKHCRWDEGLGDMHGEATLYEKANLQSRFW